MSTAEQALPETDLASLASQAAIELDNLLLGKSSNLKAVQILASTISAALSGQLLDLTTAVAMQRALVESPHSGVLDTVTDLQSNGAVVSKRLGEIAHLTLLAGSHASEVEGLRSFCVALSRHSSGLRPSPYDVREHPSQR